MRAMLMLAFSTLVVPSLVLAQDPAAGLHLAERWCANCHRIAPGGPGPATDAVPTFAAIAARPGRTPDAIATFLRTPHAGMPDHGLTLRQAQDIAAYLLAQRAP